MDEIILEANEKMEKTIENLLERFKTIVCSSYGFFFLFNLPLSVGKTDRVPIILVFIKEFI